METEAKVEKTRQNHETVSLERTSTLPLNSSITPYPERRNPCTFPLKPTKSDDSAFFSAGEKGALAVLTHRRQIHTSPEVASPQPSSCSMPRLLPSATRRERMRNIPDPLQSARESMPSRKPPLHPEISSSGQLSLTGLAQTYHSA